VHGYPDFPAPFIEEIFLSPMSVLSAIVKNQLTVDMWIFFWALYSVLLAYFVCFYGSAMLF
jgi:hypothetical protein